MYMRSILFYRIITKTGKGQRLRTAEVSFLSTHEINTHKVYNWVIREGGIEIDTHYSIGSSVK